MQGEGHHKPGARSHDQPSKSKSKIKSVKSVYAKRKTGLCGTKTALAPTLPLSKSV